MAYADLSALPTVDKYDVNKYIISPLFYGDDFMSYMDVIPDIKGKTVIDNFGKLTGLTRAYAVNTEFAGQTANIGNSVTIDPKRMEMEVQFSGNSLFNKIKGQLLRSNTEFDNIDGTVVKQALLDLVGRGIRYDYQRQIFLSEVHSNDGFIGNYDGMFVASFDAKNATQKAATVLDSSDVAGLSDNAGLAAGEAINILETMYSAAPAELLDSEGRVFFVTGSIADDYQKSLESANFAAAAYGALTEGGVMTYRGIPLMVRRDWDGYLSTSATELSWCSDAAENYAAMLTCRNAFIVGTDFDGSSVEQWYSQDHKAYRFRVGYMVGIALSNPDLCVTLTPDQIASA